MMGEEDDRDMEKDMDLKLMLLANNSLNLSALKTSLARMRATARLIMQLKEVRPCGTIVEGTLRSGSGGNQGFGDHLLPNEDNG